MTYLALGKEGLEPPLHGGKQIFSSSSGEGGGSVTVLLPRRRIGDRGRPPGSGPAFSGFGTTKSLRSFASTGEALQGSDQGGSRVGEKERSVQAPRCATGASTELAAVGWGAQDQPARILRYGPGTGRRRQLPGTRIGLEWGKTSGWPDWSRRSCNDTSVPLKGAPAVASRLGSTPGRHVGKTQGTLPRQAHGNGEG